MCNPYLSIFEGGWSWISWITSRLFLNRLLMNICAIFLSVQPKLSAAKCRLNVENFIAACRRLGVPEVNINFIFYCLLLLLSSVFWSSWDVLSELFVNEKNLLRPLTCDCNNVKALLCCLSIASSSICSFLCALLFYVYLIYLS